MESSNSECNSVLYDSDLLVIRIIYLLISGCVIFVFIFIIFIFARRRPTLGRWRLRWGA